MLRILTDTLTDGTRWIFLGGGLFAGLAGILAYTYWTGANWHPWALLTVAAIVVGVTGETITSWLDGRQHQATHDPDNCKES
jgi:hypothetical protein